MLNTKKITKMSQKTLNGLAIVLVLLFTSTNANFPKSLGDLSHSMLQAHNAYRNLHKDTPNLKWSMYLSRSSSRYALKLARGALLGHDRTWPDGENIFYSDSKSGIIKPKDAVEQWYKEGENYDYSKNFPAINTGHFTQVVWRSTAYVGCYGYSVDAKNIRKTYIVCRYMSKGNVYNSFINNVKPLKIQTVTCKDTTASCPFMKRNCFQKFLKKSMERRCPKTCNYC